MCIKMIIGKGSKISALTNMYKNCDVTTATLQLGFSSLLYSAMGVAQDRMDWILYLRTITSKVELKLVEQRKKVFPIWTIHFTI